MTCLVIAHRGASFDEPENTIPAFERAIAAGADYVELDVQASADGTLVVFHDFQLDRLTPLRGPLRHRHSRELAEVGIPTLEDVLEITHGRIGVMAELKGAWRSRRHDLPRRTAALLRQQDVVLSFERGALLAVKAAFPKLRVLQHVGYGVSVRAASRYSWGVGFHDPRVTRRGLRAAAKLGLVATVYTVNDERRIRELAALGVGGIISDRPDLLRRALSGPPAG